MWVRKGLTPWFHGVPTIMTRGACQILGRVAGQFSHFFQVERHMAYTLNYSCFIAGVLLPDMFRSLPRFPDVRVSRIMMLVVLATSSSRQVRKANADGQRKVRALHICYVYPTSLHTLAFCHIYHYHNQKIQIRGHSQGEYKDFVLCSY
ncbi:hypothetical protein PROFUN_02333 [Planoprotostelium fungivorum]|uniref:Uncharacterized protein n=1 Tax=Planoprotostelium fungivorum TaxID=1890364 RepID=A0A2P6NYL7_9EUKA|nr:hypothetical protein PROFUN_02333 [Planoprotostelium fungivorum]